MPKSNQEKANLEKARGEVYSFFSSFFLHPPTSDLVQNLLSEEGVLALKAIFGGQPDMNHIMKLAESYHRGEVKENDFVLDYEQLFRVAGETYVHPYESVYRMSFSPRGGPVKGLVMGSSAIDVTRIYENQGLSLKKGFCELPDHLGVELEYMAYLCRISAEAIEKGDHKKNFYYRSRQIYFLENHLLSWAPDCLAKMEQNASTPLYRNLSRLLEVFLGEERGCAVSLREISDGNGRRCALSFNDVN